VYADVEYAPYGEPYGASGNADFSFTGQNQDTVSGTISNPSSGLYDFLFREYNPQHGRWISPDPAGFGAVNLVAPQTWNRYAYLGNGPLNQVDPMGLNPNTSKYGDCIGCNPYMHSSADKGGPFDFAMVTGTLTTDG
jgi:RHS repeat-associated protein